MNTKEIVKTIENLTGLYFEISINDNQTEVASTFNPEKMNHEYFNACNELESYFTELYLDSNNLILERILYLLNNGLKLWNRLKKESFNINLNFENKELKHLETELTDAELLRIAEIKTHYIQNLISRIENLTSTPIVKALPPQPNVKQKDEEEAPKIFDELFYNTELVDPCIDILKELDPPLIDTDCNYIGKLKGVFCVWIDEMQRQGIVKSNYQEERKLLASLIPQKIKRFSIDESMFGKYHTKAEKNYRTDIKTKVSKIKLSQDSQKGKQGNLSL